MAPYTYKKLDRSRDEIRLMRLLPGEFDDKIECTIFHSPLPPAPSTQSSRMSLEKIRKTLPDPQSLAMGVTPEDLGDGKKIPDPEIWGVGETLGGRYIFFHTGTVDSTVPNTFEHPVRGFDRSSYIQPPSAKYEPDFEALSYVWGSPFDLATAHTEPRFTLPIGRNLALTLRHLRFKDRHRTLWVDAVCLYLDRYRTRYRGNSRSRPLFSEGFRSTHLG